jgi:hypothetical protein
MAATGEINRTHLTFFHGSARMGAFPRGVHI